MSEVTLSKIRWLLAKAYPRIGSRPVAKITPQEALTVLRSIEATSASTSDTSGIGITTVSKSSCS